MKLKKAILITTEPEVVKEVSPKNNRKFTLEELQKMVDGLVEFVDLGEGITMIINDDGKFRSDFELNLFATQLFSKAYPNTNDYIVGPALICPSSMLN